MAKRRYRNYYKTAYHGENDVIVDTVIDRIEFKNAPIGRNGRLKTVFYCKSYYAPEGRMCIIYDYQTIQAGDKIAMTGFFADSAFIARSLQIKERAKEPENNIKGLDDTGVFVEEINAKEQEGEVKDADSDSGD